MADSYFANVSALLHFDGADASTTFTDSSSYAHTFTANGNAQLDTAQFLYGTASGLSDGTSDYLTAADATEFRLGGGDFTIEAAIRFNAIPTAGGIMVVTQKGRAADNNLEFSVYLIESAGSVYMRFVGSTDGTATTSVDSSAVTVATNTWYKFAWVRDTNTIRFFQDGAAKGTGAYSSTLYGGTAALALFAGPTGASCMNGWMDEFRLTKGVARYTGAYTPTSQAFPDSATDPINIAFLSIPQLPMQSVISFSVSSYIRNNL